jgi:hypothetical protein
MIDSFVIIYLLTCHFIADFIMQTREMAVNKSSSTYWLTRHVFAYGNTMLFSGFVGVVIMYLFGIELFHLIPLIIGYVLLNAGLHWVTDYFTSKQTTRLYMKEQDKIKPNYHNFFVMIGLDQLIHGVCLIGTYIWMFT